MQTTYQTYLRKRERPEDTIGNALNLLAANVLCLAIDSIVTQLKHEIQKSLYYEEI